MSDCVKKVKADLLSPHLAQASRTVKDYTAIFVFEDGRVASGVFVNTSGFEGILTAHHVARAVFQSSEFGLCITQHPHSLWVNSEHFEHIIVGDSTGNPGPEHGPDLSFIIIRDSNLLEVLRSLKSFCYLESQKTTFFHSLHLRNWFIAGSPHEDYVRIQGVKPTEGAVGRLTNFVGDAVFLSRTTRDGFDYIDLAATSGNAGFPYSYEGVSGGGFWLIALEIDANEDLSTIGTAAPVLAGIAFHQSAPKDSDRVIKGHGFDSVYVKLREVLKQQGSQ